MKKNITIIDYGSGNILSAKQSFARVIKKENIDADVCISGNPETIKKSTHIVLPGQGAFKTCINGLEGIPGMIDELNNFVINKKKPFFGICLGMQLIFSKSEEFGSGKGLDLLPGLIKKFPTSINGDVIKVPQIAWNKIRMFKKKWEGTPLFDIEENEFMYFVHSYYAVPAEDDNILTKTNYCGLEYCSAIIKENIILH